MNRRVFVRNSMFVAAAAGLGIVPTLEAVSLRPRKWHLHNIMVAHNPVGRENYWIACVNYLDSEGSVILHTINAPGTPDAYQHSTKFQKWFRPASSESPIISPQVQSDLGSDFIPNPLLIGSEGYPLQMRTGRDYRQFEAYGQPGNLHVSTYVPYSPRVTHPDNYTMRRSQEGLEERRVRLGKEYLIFMSNPGAKSTVNDLSFPANRKNFQNLTGFDWNEIAAKYLLEA